MRDQSEQSPPEEARTEESFAALLEQEQTGPALSSGQVVKGRVILIGGDSIFIDVRDKGEGIIDRAELENEQGELDIAVGDEVEATVLSTEGELRLSRKLLKGAQARQRLALSVEHALPVEGTVTRETKGGIRSDGRRDAGILSLLSDEPPPARFPAGLSQPDV